MSKPQKEQLKENYEVLSSFVESLSKKQTQKCNKLVLKMIDPLFGYARNCIQTIQIVNTFTKQKSQYLIEIKRLKNNNKTLREDVERLSRVKGFKLTQSQKQINGTLSVFDLLKNGMYIQANRTTMRPFPFIQELVQYNSIKTILRYMQSHQKIQEEWTYGGSQYKELKKYLQDQGSMSNDLSSEVEAYLLKTDGIQDEEEWPNPRYLPEYLFVKFKDIQFKLRTLRNQNRGLRDLINESQFQTGLTALTKSTNYEISINQEQRQISSKIRDIQRSFAKNSARSLINKTSLEILQQIQGHIKSLSKANQYLSKKSIKNDDQLGDKVMIMSLEERVSQLEGVQKKMSDTLRENTRFIRNLLLQDHDLQLYGNDTDSLIQHLGTAVKAVIRQHDQKQKHFANLIKERDSYKNQFNKLHLISNISEEFQNKLNLMRSSTSEQTSYQELKIKIQELQIKINGLDRDKVDMGNVITEKIDEIQQLKKTIKERQSELSEIRKQIYDQQKHMKSHLKNQREKIKELEWKSNQSLLSSHRSSNEALQSSLRMVKKQSNDFLAAIRQASEPERNQKIQIQFTTQVQKLKIQIQNNLRKIDSLNKELTQLQEKYAFLQTKLYKQQLQINQLSEQLTKKDEMLEQAYKYSNQLFEKPRDGDQTYMVNQILKSKSEENGACNSCEKMITQNLQFKQRIQKMKERIQELYKKNLKIYEQNQKDSKQKRELSSKHQKIKEILFDTQKKLQQAQNENIQIKQQLSLISKLNSTLKQQNEQLKSTTNTQKSEFNNPIEKQRQSICLSTRPHLFTAKGIFEQNQQPQRQFLIQTLQSEIGPIYQTKFLYSFDNLNKVNFHRYIDSHKNLVVIIKTIYGRLIAAFSESEVSINGTYRGVGLLLPLWSRQVFYLNQDKKPVTYDDYFLIFGNSQIRIKSQEDRVFSNFGIANGYFNCERKKVEHLLGEPERQIDIQTYQIYSVVFERDRC